VTGPKPLLDSLGLANGDVVVALGGYIVEGPAELACAVQLAPRLERKAVVWHAGRYTEVAWPDRLGPGLGLRPLGKR
jgi:hypothetical protein